MIVPAVAQTLTPEQELLLLCLRRELCPEHSERLRQLLAAELNWIELVPLARWHNSTTLLAMHLEAVAPELVPPAWRRMLRRYVATMGWLNLRLANAMLEAVGELGSRGIVAVPYKGPMLAQALHGNLAVRESADVDILVRQADIAQATAILESLGYRPYFDLALATGNPHPTPTEYPFRHLRTLATVEVHTERTLRHFPVCPDFDEVWTRLKRLRLGGREIPFLSPEDLLIFLCVHGTKDYWERLMWVCDVAELPRAFPALDWDVVFARARRLGVERMLLLGLALAGRALGAGFPEVAETRIRREPGLELLTDRVVRHWFTLDDRGNTGFSRLRFRAQARAAGIRGLAYSLRLALLPTDEDLEVARLPRALAPAYLPLRMLRLFRRYGLRAPERSLSEFVGTPPEIIGPLLDFAGVGEGDMVVELGCGDGRCLIAAARNHRARGLGVDLDETLLERARAAARAEGVSHLVQFRRQNALTADVSAATVVLLYLPGDFNLRLRPKLQHELPRGARVVSRGWDMGDWEPEQTRVVADSRGIETKMYRWRI
jgi:hypothetical protein